MKKMGVGVVHLGNIGAMTQTMQMFPENEFLRFGVLAMHLIVSAVLPSIGGVGHKLVFGGDQEGGNNP